MKPPVTITAAELAELLGCSTWLVYQMVRAGTCPIEPIRLGGRKLVWPRSAVDRLLGLSEAGNGGTVPTPGAPEGAA